MMTYYTQLGTLRLPNGFADRTLHVLVAQGEGPGFNIVISLSPVEPDEDLDAYVEREITDLRRQVSKLEVTSKKTMKLGATATTGYCIELQYKQKGAFLYHRQGVFVFPQRRDAMTIVASSTAPFTDTQRAAFDAVVATFTLH